MSITLYVGNLSSSVSDDDLIVRFCDYGAVESAAVNRDHSSALGARGGQVVMANDEEAQGAIDWLHDTPFKGRVISVTRAAIQEPFWLHFDFPQP